MDLQSQRRSVEDLRLDGSQPVVMSVPTGVDTDHRLASLGDIAETVRGNLGAKE